MRNAEITGWGMSVPPAILTNEDLETICDTNDEWIVTRTGIKERRISHVKTSEMAVVAARRAMACAGLGPEDIDLLIVATCTPDTLIPAAAAFVQAELGLTKAGAYDLNAACSGWVYALTQGNAMIKAGAAETVLIVGVERLSRYLDFADRTTCVLFGDGAGATVLQATDGDHGVLSGTLGIDGTTAEYLWIPDSGTNEHHLDKSDDGQAVRMDGPEVFKRAVRMMGDSSLKVVADAGLGRGQGVHRYPQVWQYLSSDHSNSDDRGACPGVHQTGFDHCLHCLRRWTYLGSSCGQVGPAHHATRNK
jgi:3-oxoacyl-[acyl-carrier-protein] synthase-3